MVQLGALKVRMLAGRAALTDEVIMPEAGSGSVESHATQIEGRELAVGRY